MIKKEKHFGKSFDKDLNFPKHLTPEVVHTALYVHNAPNKLETVRRVEYCTKQIGEQLMSYAMALLVLPWLMDQGMNSDVYKDFIASRKKTIN